MAETAPESLPVEAMSLQSEDKKKPDEVKKIDILLNATGEFLDFRFVYFFLLESFVFKAMLR